MKNFILILSASFFSFVYIDKYPKLEKEFDMKYQKNEKEYISLIKNKAFYYAGNSLLSLQGYKSSLRMKPYYSEIRINQKKPVFYLNFKKSINRPLYLKLLKFNIITGKRRIAKSIESLNPKDIEFIPFKCDLIDGNSIHKITISKELEPGSYCFCFMAQKNMKTTSALGSFMHPEMTTYAYDFDIVE